MCLSVGRAISHAGRSRLSPAPKTTTLLLCSPNPFEVGIQCAACVSSSACGAVQALRSRRREEDGLSAMKPSFSDINGQPMILSVDDEEGALPSCSGFLAPAS